VSTTPSFPIAALLTAILASPVTAQEPSKEHVKALIQQAMAQTQPGQPPSAAAPQGPVVNLTVEEAVARALERNLTIASERLTPRTFDYSLAAAYASYRPTFSSTVSNQSQVNLPTSVFSGGSRFTQDTQRWNSGLTQSVPWGGGSYSLSWNNSRAFSDASDVTFNPNFASNVQASYTQPLLRDFAIDNTRAQLLTTRISQDQAEIALRSTVASTLAAVRNAYWELAFAYQALDAARRSMELATKLVDDNRARVEIGTMAPIDVVQAQAEEASRRQQLVTAQATLRNNELALKQLIVSGTDDELWSATINPVDQPSPVAEPIDLEGAVTNALQHRTDILSNRKSLESAAVNIKSLENQTKPQLNLVAGYNLLGRGGTEFRRDRLNDNAIIATIPGGYGDALSAIRGFDAPTWNVQVNFSYPIGQSAAEANLARQRLLVQQSEVQIKTTELQVATDVTTAALAVRNALEAHQAAQASRELSERRLEAAQSKFEVGMATNFEVVQAQRDLNDARNSELRQLLNYRRALVDFERVQVSPR
jgi:outer membrane protein TolC